jgi:hypothetical protein
MTGRDHKSEEVDQLDDRAYASFEHNTHTVDLLETVEVELLVHVAEFSFEEGKHQDDEIDPLCETYDD